MLEAGQGPQGQPSSVTHSWTIVHSRDKDPQNSLSFSTFFPSANSRDYKSEGNIFPERHKTHRPSLFQMNECISITSAGQKSHPHAGPNLGHYPLQHTVNEPPRISEQGSGSSVKAHPGSSLNAGSYKDILSYTEAEPTSFSMGDVQGH